MISKKQKQIEDEFIKAIEKQGFYLICDKNGGLLFYIFSNDEPNIGAWYNGKAVDATACKVNGVDSYRIFQPNASGSEVDDKIIQKIKELTGLPVGINLEPVDPNANALENLHSLPEGRTATENSLAMAKQLGCDFICLTGNPKSGVTNEKIEQAITLANKHFGGLIIAGKCIMLERQEVCLI